MHHVTTNSSARASKRAPRTAVILAAGAGSRLLPHTAHAPKCLTPIGGFPILQYQVAALRECGIDDLVIVVGYLPHCIRGFARDAATYVENPDYASTNSSHSLWLAREHLREGYIHLNSDLLFEPRMLRALLDSPHENAVIVQRTVNAASDMMKARMDGARIREMGKHLTSGAVAEVVGPAKFGPEGAARLISALDRLQAAGERNRWAYAVFGELADAVAFTGVDNPGCFWAEVDTVDDARDAERRIPRRLVECAAGWVPRAARVAI
jgi:choline kinase